MDKFEDIAISKIVPNEDNDKVFSMSEIKELADTIKKEGFYGGIEVYKIPGKDKFEISSGHRRFEAMKLLKKKTIPCIVSEYPSEYKRGIKMLASNIRSRKLSPLDMARAIEYYKELCKKEGIKGDFKELASEFFHMSPIQIYRHQCLLRLIPELQNMANDPQFPYSAFREAATLSENGQRQLYNELSYFLAVNDSEEKEYKLTRARIEQLIGNIKTKEKPQEEKKSKINATIPKDSDIDYKPTALKLDPVDSLVVSPAPIAVTNTYQEPAFGYKDEDEDDYYEQEIEDKQQDDETHLLLITEKLSLIEDEINELPDEFKFECKKYLQSMIERF